MTNETDSSWVLSQAEYDELVAFRERTMTLIRRVFADDNDAGARAARVLTGPDGELAGTELMTALDRALDERDRAREAAERLRRLTAKGDSYTLALLEGRA